MSDSRNERNSTFFPRGDCATGRTSKARGLRSTWTTTVTGVVVLGLVGAACSSSSKNSTSSTTASSSSESSSPGAGSAAPFKVALVGDLSGALSGDGIAGVTGIQTAIDNANSSGGVNGQKIDLGTPIDAMSTTTGSVSAIQQAIAQSPVAIMGAAYSTDIQAMVPSLTQSNTPFVSMQNFDTLSYPTPKSWFWTSSVTSAQEATLEVAGMKAMLGGSLQGKKVAFALLNSPGVIATVAPMKTMIQQAGGVVGTTQYTATAQSSSFSSQAVNIVADHPAGVITVDSDPNTILEVKALRTAGFSGPVTASTGANDDVTLKTANDPNFFVPRFYNTIDSSTSLKQAASQAGTSRKATNAFFSQGYAAGLILIAALKGCGSSCTAKTLPAALAGIGTLDIGDLGFGPLMYSTTRNYGVSTVQFFAWNSSTQSSGAKFSPIQV